MFSHDSVFEKEWYNKNILNNDIKKKKKSLKFLNTLNFLRSVVLTSLKEIQAWLKNKDKIYKIR